MKERPLAALGCAPLDSISEVFVWRTFKLQPPQLGLSLAACTTEVGALGEGSFGQVLLVKDQARGTFCFVSFGAKPMHRVEKSTSVA